MRCLVAALFVSICGCGAAPRTQVKVAEVKTAGAVRVAIRAIDPTTFDVTVERDRDCFRRTTTVTTRDECGQSQLSDLCFDDPGDPKSSDAKARMCADWSKGCVLDRHVENTPARACGGPSIDDAVSVRLWDGSEKQMKTGADGVARVHFSDASLRLPSAASQQFAAALVKDANAVYFDVRPAAFAASIMARRAFDEVDRFQARFGDDPALGDLQRMRDQAIAAEHEAEARATKNDLERRREEIKTATRDLLAIKNLRGECGTCRGDVLDLLIEKEGMLQALGESELLAEVGARIEQIRKWRARPQVSPNRELQSRIDAICSARPRPKSGGPEVFGVPTRASFSDLACRDEPLIDNCSNEPSVVFEHYPRHAGDQPMSVLVCDSTNGATVTFDLVVGHIFEILLNSDVDHDAILRRLEAKYGQRHAYDSVEHIFNSGKGLGTAYEIKTSAANSGSRIVFTIVDEPLEDKGVLAPGGIRWRSETVIQYAFDKARRVERGLSDAEAAKLKL